MHKNEENNKLVMGDSIFEEIMTKPKKRIHNETTHSYYEIRQRTTKYGRKGQIKGKWKKKK